MTEQCDCTSYCGDDPRLSKKTVEPCGMVKRAAYREQSRRDTADYLRDMARRETTTPDDAIMLRKAAGMI
jgi:hypothetical protein